MNIPAVINFVMAGVSAITLIIGRPWTGLLARRHAPPEARALPVWDEMNQVMTGAWTLLFALGGVICALTPAWVGIALGVLYSLLGFLSPKAGQRYVYWRMMRNAE